MNIKYKLNNEENKMRKVKKVSKSHQLKMVERMKKLGYSESEIRELLNDDSLFAGNKSKQPSVTFRGTDMTIHKPTLPIRPRGNKNTKMNYNNVMTEDLLKARQAYDIRTQDIYEDIVREFALEHTLGGK